MTSVHLFPHSYLPEEVIKKITAAFGHLRIYIPWSLDLSDLIINPGLEIVNPPENLKPFADIKAILSGYRQWTEQNRDKGVREFFKFSEKTRKDDGSTWEIRTLLKKAADPASGAKEEEIALKRHILLHLAYEVEKQNFEIMDMTRAMKKRGPVLAALQGPEEAGAVLNDLQELTGGGKEDNLNIGLVLDAWFGLFGGYIEKNDVLITCSGQALDYLTFQWEEEQATKALPGNPEEIPQGLKEMPGITIKYFPASSVDTPTAAWSLLKHIAGKTIILMPLESD